MLAYLIALKLKILAALESHAASTPSEAERGNGLVEMALILALVVIVAIGVLQTLGVDIVSRLTEVANALH